MKGSPVTEEEDIIQRCLNGERDAFSIFVENYQKMVYTVAYRMLGDENAAKDAAQDSFIAAYVSLKNFKKDSKFSTWLVSIAINKCRSILRSKKEAVSLTEVEDILRSHDADPEELLDKRQAEGLLQAALNRLPREYREAIVLKHIQELDYHEMAALSGMSIGALKVRVHRGREMLRELLKRGGIRR